MKPLPGDRYGNLYPSAYMRDTGPMAAMCEQCGRVGHIYHAAFYPFGIIAVNGWRFEDGAWWVDSPRCVDRTACDRRAEAVERAIERVVTAR